MRIIKISRMINLRTKKNKIKETFKREIEKLKKDNDDTNNKLRILEDRSIRNNVRFDSIEESEEESWVDTEQNLKDTFSEILGIQNRNRVGEKTITM